MIMEILTGNGGDSVLFARYTGGILSSSTKKSGGGDSVRGGFCPTLFLFRLDWKQNDLKTCSNDAQKQQNQNWFILSTPMLHLFIAKTCCQIHMAP